MLGFVFIDDVEVIMPGFILEHCSLSIGEGVRG
jgi:hypothetical protein